MHAATAETFQLEEDLAALSPEAKKDLEWLTKKLGVGRVRGPEVDEDGDYCVTLVRADGRHAWFYGCPSRGEGASVAVQRARAAVEYGMKNPRRRL